MAWGTFQHKRVRRDYIPLLMSLVLEEFEGQAPIVWMPQMESQTPQTLGKLWESIHTLVFSATHMHTHTRTLAFS